LVGIDSVNRRGIKFCQRHAVEIDKFFWLGKEQSA
jgi:hypothetical protein